MPIDIANMIVNIKAAQNFDWGNFWITLIGGGFGAGFGALSAYWLNRTSENLKEGKQNINSLKSLTQVLVAQLDILMDLKTNVSTQQLEELSRIKNDMVTKNYTEMRKASAVIMHNDNFIDYDISRIDFSNNHDPNFFYYVSVYFNQVRIIKNIINEYNTYVKEHIHCKDTQGIIKQEPIEKTQELVENLENFIIKLAKANDEAIFMNYKTLKNCMSFGIDYFGKNNTMEVIIRDNYMKEFATIKPFQWYEVKKRNFAEKYFPSLCSKKGGE